MIPQPLKEGSDFLISVLIEASEEDQNVFGSIILFYFFLMETSPAFNMLLILVNVWTNFKD